MTYPHDLWRSEEYISWFQFRDIYILLLWECRYHVAQSLRDMTLRYVDDVMNLFSILTRMLDGQSFEISPNKWHSLCTPPVCRKTIPKDLENKKKERLFECMCSENNDVRYWPLQSSVTAVLNTFWRRHAWQMESIHLYFLWLMHDVNIASILQTQTCLD